MIFPEGAQIPRSLTDVERQFMEDFPGISPRSTTPPPSGPIHCVAEYESMEGILLAWESFNSLLIQMTQQITTTGNAKVYMVVDDNNERTTVSNTLSANGVDLNKVVFVVRTTDTVWIRDYGPRYIYEGQCRAIIDHAYNRPRPNDDVLPSYFSAVKHHAYYELGVGSYQLVHGGGNFHLDANNHSFATELIWNENTSLTHLQVHDIWQNYQNVDTHIFPPFPTSIDSTQHLDMWMQVIGDNKVIISDWPNNVGSAQDVICDNAAIYMAGQGYTVYRVPARSVSGVHYTYTNTVMCNNLVLVPSYTNGTVSPHNAQALAVFQSALPGKTIVQLDCQAIIPSAGAMHCIAMHVPVPLGGVNPTVRLQTMRGGQVVAPGSQQTIKWISDDDVLVTSVDIQLSMNGGATYPTSVATGLADSGQFTWTVPNIYGSHVRLRIVVHDADSHAGTDASESDFTINGIATILGDMNCDGVVDLNDVPPFTQALIDPTGFTGCNIQLANMNQDGAVNAADIGGFAAAVIGP